MPSHIFGGKNGIATSPVMINLTHKAAASS